MIATTFPFPVYVLDSVVVGWMVSVENTGSGASNISSSNKKIVFEFRSSASRVLLFI